MGLFLTIQQSIISMDILGPKSAKAIGYSCPGNSLSDLSVGQGGISFPVVPSPGGLQGSDGSGRAHPDSPLP